MDALCRKKLCRKEPARPALLIVEAFTEARTAEAGRTKLHTQALKNMNAWKGTKPFFVRTVCSYTVEKITFEKCPSCLNPKTKYVKVK